MALPPLPDVFGNYAIREIVEVLAPESIGWYPATSGWKFLLVLALLVLGRGAWRYWRHWQRNRYRGAALAQLQRFRDEALAPNVRLSRIAALLKATALQAYPRRDIASLSGDRWLEWLDASAEGTIFSQSSHTLLLDALYRRDSPPQAADIIRLQQESAAWIRRQAQRKIPTATFFVCTTSSYQMGVS